MYYSNNIAIAILLVKCPQQIRKYVVDTSVLFKYSLANNVKYIHYCTNTECPKSNVLSAALPVYTS